LADKLIKIVDQDGDGELTEQELLEFLKSKGVDKPEKHARE